ncbi:hypothetical protein M6B38_387015 [Iris pallida]|uniref:Uncharacterized protein n=1 Tax=Iris pallida TaxID=29817 RepID=A0AAX6G2T0_IRIPA|nr:hypothetical protein M6B38_387015 [Iris pallida]
MHHFEHIKQITQLRDMSLEDLSKDTSRRHLFIVLVGWPTNFTSLVVGRKLTVTNDKVSIYLQSLLYVYRRIEIKRGFGTKY